MRCILCLFYVLFILVYIDLEIVLKIRVGDKKIFLSGRQENIYGAAVRPINTNLARLPNCSYD